MLISSFVIILCHGLRSRSIGARVGELTYFEKYFDSGTKIE